MALILVAKRYVYLGFVVFIQCCMDISIYVCKVLYYLFYFIFFYLFLNALILEIAFLSWGKCPRGIL